VWMFLLGNVFQQSMLVPSLVRSMAIYETEEVFNAQYN
jgi:hypothetical protein